MRVSSLFRKRHLGTAACLLWFSFVCLVSPVFAEPLSMNAFSRVDSSYNFVFVEMRLGVNVSQSMSWRQNVEDLWSYLSGGIGLKAEFDKSVEDVLNVELGKAIPGAYVSTVDVSLTKISLYNIWSTDFFEIRTSFRVYNVIQKNFLSSFTLDTRFRNLKADQNITVGSKTFNPANDFLVNLSDFKTPLTEWKQEPFEGKIAYILEKTSLASNTEFGVIHFDAKQTIVLPPDTITSSVGDEYITYYTGQNFAETAGVAGVIVLLAGALIFMMRRLTRK